MDGSQSLAFAFVDGGFHLVLPRLAAHSGPRRG